MIKILGHRGAQHTAGFYENTLAAFEEGMAAADGLETDTVRSRDGTIFLCHDTVFVTQVEYELARHLDERSKALFAGRRLDQLPDTVIDEAMMVNGDRLPRLTELLEVASHYPQTTLNLEIKGENAALSTVATVHDAIRKGQIRKDQVIISSFNHGQLLQVRQADPQIKLGLLMSLEHQPAGNRLHPWSATDFGCYTPYNADYLASEIVQEIKPEFINVDLSIARPDAVKAIHSHLPGTQLMVWYLKEPHVAENTALLAALRNPEVSPYIFSLITGYPRETKAFLSAQNFLNTPPFPDLKP